MSVLLKLLRTALLIIFLYNGNSDLAQKMSFLLLSKDTVKIFLASGHKKMWFHIHFKCSRSFVANEPIRLA